MFVGLHNDIVLFRTPFNSTHDLVQKFRGFNNTTIDYNAPIDFMEAGLIDNSKWDYWHTDVLFNVSNDEAVPHFVNSCHIGANHGQSCGIQVFSQNHGKTYADIGNVYLDSKGVTFYLVRIIDGDRLLFVSENVSADENAYSFVKTITGNLTKANTNGKSQIIVQKQNVSYLSRSNRYKCKKIVGYKNDKVIPLFYGGECDVAQIHEEYDIINPATVAIDLIKRRPDDGYTENPDLANFGKPMINVKLIYRILADGTVLTIIDNKRLMGVDLQFYHGVMYQEKLDVYGGGIYRMIPKTLPFETEEGAFDFSKPLPISGAYPKRKKLTKEYWKAKDFPPDRVVDYFKDKDGENRLAFSCGFLPIDDGDPQVRKNKINSAFNLISTRKMYPNLVDGNFINSVKGVGYKKFFIPEKDFRSAYTIDYQNKRYIYVDLVDDGKVTITTDSRVTLIEKGDNVEWIQDCSSLTVTGKGTYAVFLQNL